MNHPRLLRSYCHTSQTFDTKWFTARDHCETARGIFHSAGGVRSPIGSSTRSLETKNIIRGWCGGLRRYELQSAWGGLTRTNRSQQRKQRILRFLRWLLFMVGELNRDLRGSRRFRSIATQWSAWNSEVVAPLIPSIRVPACVYSQLRRTIAFIWCSAPDAALYLGRRPTRSPMRRGWGCSVRGRWRLGARMGSRSPRRGAIRLSIRRAGIRGASRFRRLHLLGVSRAAPRRAPVATTGSVPAEPDPLAAAEPRSTVRRRPTAESPRRSEGSGVLYFMAAPFGEGPMKDCSRSADRS